MLNRKKRSAPEEASAPKAAPKRTRRGQGKAADHSSLQEGACLTRHRAKEQGQEPVPAENDPERLLRHSGHKEGAADRRQAREMDRRNSQGPSQEVRMSCVQMDLPTAGAPPHAPASVRCLAGQRGRRHGHARAKVTGHPNSGGHEWRQSCGSLGEGVATRTAPAARPPPCRPQGSVPPPHVHIRGPRRPNTTAPPRPCPPLCSQRSARPAAPPRCRL